MSTVFKRVKDPKTGQLVNGPKSPRFKIGDTIDELTIVSYIGWYASRGSTNKSHQYTAMCSCGNVVDVSQAYLSAGSRTHKCGNCSQRKGIVDVRTSEAELIELRKQWKPTKPLWHEGRPRIENTWRGR